MAGDRKFTVLVEGNIGCGKSTFLQYFEHLSRNNEIIQEPHSLWKDVGGHNLFELMYQDYIKWSIPFQSQVIVTLIALQVEKQTAPVRLMERSIYSSRTCFVEYMLSRCVISPSEYAKFDEIYHYLLKEKATPIDRIVYLRASPSVCLERIKQRKRPGEDEISLECLQKLHDYHEDWLINERFGRLPGPVSVFDCNASLQQLVKEYYERRSEVMCGIPLS